MASQLVKYAHICLDTRSNVPDMAMAIVAILDLASLVIAVMRHQNLPIKIRLLAYL